MRAVVGSLVTWFALTSCSTSSGRADLVLKGGRVYTVDPRRPWAEAVAVAGDTLLTVGPSIDIDRTIGPETVVVDLDGRLVLPGLSDGHIHFLDGSFGLDQVRLDEARSVEDMKAIVKAYAEAHPERPWIVGMGWNYSFVGGNGLPHRRDLDDAVPERPAFLTAYDGHTAWANSKALEAAGIDRNTRWVGYGEIVRDPATGEPTGSLKEDAMELVSRIMPTPSRDERLEALRRGMDYAIRFGVTSVQIAGGSLDSRTGSNAWGDALDLYEELERRGELDLRVSFALSVNEGTSDDELEAYAEKAKMLRGPWLRAGAVKVMMDGVVESHTAAMLEPYADDPSATGSTEYTAEEIDSLFSRLDPYGFQILTHAIGDRAVRMVLDAYEKSSGADRRHRIEHIEVVSTDDLPRFARLGVLASMQPYHATPDSSIAWARNVGPQRLTRAFAWKSLVRAGAPLVFGSDWPVVTLDPLVGVYCAVTRQDLDGEPEGGWIPGERLTLEEAIYGYTLGAAYGSFEESIRGSLEPGKLADLVVLDRDLFKVTPDVIPQTEISVTVIGGRIVHSSPELRRNAAHAVTVQD